MEVRVAIGMGEAENLLELIGQDEDAPVFMRQEMVDRVEQAARPASQRLLATRHDGVGQFKLRLADERSGEISKGIASRLHHNKLPVRVAVAEITTLQRRQQSRANQRRLSTAAGADDGQKVLLPQDLQHADDVSAPPVEQRRLAELEGPQTGKWRDKLN